MAKMDADQERLDINQGLSDLYRQFLIAGIVNRNPRPLLVRLNWWVIIHPGDLFENIQLSSIVRMMARLSELPLT